MITVTYVIVPFVEVTQQMIDNSCETSMDTLRHTISGEDRVILKWVGDIAPSSLSGYVQYTYEEILIELAKPEWQGDEYLDG